MGQFDIVMYIVQIFWVLLVLCVCYYFFMKYVISVLYINLRIRKLFEDSLQHNISNLLQGITTVILNSLGFYKIVVEEIEALSLMLLVWDELNNFLLYNINSYNSILVDALEFINIEASSSFLVVLSSIFERVAILIKKQL